ncbi:DUF4397 domain-containing protein [Haladaptatus sp. NG-WS-4]
MTQTRRHVLRAIGASGLTIFGGVSSAQETATANSSEVARLRIIHAVPGVPAINVFVDGECVLNGVAYKDVSDYLEFEPGGHTLQFAPAGEGREGAFLKEQLTLEANTDYTYAAAAGTDDTPGPFLFVDNNEMPLGNQVRLRAIHLSTDAPAVDIAADGDVLVEGLKVGDASDYVEVPAGSYTLEVRPAGEKKAVATFDVTLAGGTAVSAFAVGLLEATDEAQAFDLVTTVDAEEETTTTTTATTTY